MIHVQFSLDIHYLLGTIKSREHHALVLQWSYGHSLIHEATLLSKQLTCSYKLSAGVITPIVTVSFYKYTFIYYIVYNDFRQCNMSVVSRSSIYLEETLFLIFPPGLLSKQAGMSCKRISQCNSLEIKTVRKLFHEQ